MHEAVGSLRWRGFGSLAAGRPLPQRHVPRGLRSPQRRRRPGSSTEVHRRPFLARWPGSRIVASFRVCRVIAASRLGSRRAGVSSDSSGPSTRSSGNAARSSTDGVLGASLTSGMPTARRARLLTARRERLGGSGAPGASAGSPRGGCVTPGSTFSAATETATRSASPGSSLLRTSVGSWSAGAARRDRRGCGSVAGQDRHPRCGRRHSERPIPRHRVRGRWRALAVGIASVRALPADSGSRRLDPSPMWKDQGA